MKAYSSVAMIVAMLASCLLAQNSFAATEQESTEENARALFIRALTPQKIQPPETNQPDAMDKLLSAAEALMNNGKPAEAYALLVPYDFSYSGTENFDYLLGISALDSGHPDKATLAFERVLAEDPNFAGARLDMARAYFELGDMPRAKNEFLAVLKQQPPEPARVTINKYLAAIEAIEQAKNTHYSGYTQLALGHDSNVNNSPSQAEIAVPALGNLVFTLSPTNLETPDNYYSAGAGASVNRRLTDKWGAYGGLDLSKRGNRSMTAFDTSSVSANAGMSMTVDKDMYRLGASLGNSTLGEVAYLNTQGLTGDWRHPLNQNEAITVFAQYARNRYAQSSSQINDFDQYVAGAAMQHIFAEAKAVLFGSLNWTAERAINGRADGDKTGYGLRIGAQQQLRELIEVFANAGYQIGRYSTENLAFLTARSDSLYDFTVGDNWHFSKAWLMKFQATYSKNGSSIPIYEYSRLDASLTVRRDF